MIMLHSWIFLFIAVAVLSLNWEMVIGEIDLNNAPWDFEEDKNNYSVNADTDEIWGHQRATPSPKVLRRFLEEGRLARRRRHRRHNWPFSRRNLNLDFGRKRYRNRRQDYEPFDWDAYDRDTTKPWFFKSKEELEAVTSVTSRGLEYEWRGMKFAWDRNIGDYRPVDEIPGYQEQQQQQQQNPGFAQPNDPRGLPMPDAYLYSVNNGQQPPPGQVPQIQQPYYDPNIWGQPPQIQQPPTGQVPQIQQPFQDPNWGQPPQNQQPFQDPNWGQPPQIQQPFQDPNQGQLQFQPVPYRDPNPNMVMQPGPGPLNQQHPGRPNPQQPMPFRDPDKYPTNVQKHNLPSSIGLDKRKNPPSGVLEKDWFRDKPPKKSRASSSAKSKYLVCLISFTLHFLRNVEIKLL